MENTITKEDLLILINDNREKEDLLDYLITELDNNIEEEEIKDCTKINLIEAVGLLAYQSHFVRFLVTKELLKESHMTVSDFCKEKEIDMEFGEIIVISKMCQKESIKENKIIKTKTNKNNKEVKMFDINILRKIMKIK